MKPIKTIVIGGLDFEIKINQYDSNNESRPKFYQMYIEHNSDTGVSFTMVVPLDEFDPEEIGKQLLRFEN